MTSLSTRLLIIVLLALLPALGLQAYTEAQARHVREQLVQDEVLRLLHLVRAEQQRIADSAEQVLNLVAGAPSVLDRNPADCGRLLTSLIRESPRYTDAGIIARDGTVTCSPEPREPGFNAASRPYFRQAIEQDGFVVGEYGISHASGEPTIHMARPIRGADGTITGVAALALSLRWLGQQLAALEIPTGATALVTDRNGTILAHYPDMGRTIGTPILAESRHLLDGAAVRVARTTGPDGKTRLMAYAPPGAGPPGLLIGVALDPEITFAAVTRSNRIGLLLIATGGLLALVLTSILGKRLIRRPVNRLLDAADHWRAGDLAKRTGLPNDTSEFGRIAAAFDEMVETLQAREQALHVALESTTDVVVVVDRDWRITYLNARGMARATDRDAVGQIFWDAYPEVAGTVFEDGYRTAMRTGLPQTFEAYYRRHDGYFEASAFPSADGLTIFVRDLTGERRNAAALRESEALFRAAFEQASVGMVVSTADHVALRVNDKLCEMLGYTADELIGRDSDHLTHPDDRHADHAHRETLRASNQAAPLIKRYIRKDGSILWVNVIRSSMQPADTGDSRLFAVMEDITERKQIETALRESEERLRLAMEAARLGVREVVDLATGESTLSPEAARIMGVDIDTPSDINAFFTRLHPEDRERVQAEWARTVADPSQFYETEYRYLPPGGTWRWIAAFGRAIRNAGGSRRIIVVLQDITARKHVEEALRESENRVRMSQEAGRIGTWEWDLRTDRIVWSDVQCRQFGLDPAATDPITYETWQAIVHPDDVSRVEHALHTAAMNGHDSEIEYRIIVAGKIRWLIGRGHPVRNDDGRTERMIGIDIDITERRELEDRLRVLTTTLEARVREEVAAREAAQARAALAERMQALGQLAGGIAHDMNNVLQAASGALRLIQRRPADPDGIRRYTTLGIEAIERGASITNRLLAFGRRGALRAETLDLAALLHGVHEILSYTLGAGVRLHMALPEDLPPIVADKGQLETALINLATNARDAMPQGGLLTFAVTRQHLTAVQPPHQAGLRPGHYLRLEITDTGTGMDKATLARAREPFFTTKKTGAGTGLGLPMAQGFAEQSGGAMTIDSTPGQGTTVTLWLPEAGTGVAAPPRPQHAPATAGAPARILLVDDEDMIREVLGSSLELAGYSVVRAANGAAALDCLAEAGPVDVLITDLSMPGMDGLAVIRAVQDRYPDIPAILLTGYAQDTATLALSDTVGGPVSLLRKPVSDTQLLDRLAAILAARLVDAGEDGGR